MLLCGADKHLIDMRKQQSKYLPESALAAFRGCCLNFQTKKSSICDILSLGACSEAFGALNLREDQMKHLAICCSLILATMFLAANSSAQESSSTSEIEPSPACFSHITRDASSASITIRDANGDLRETSCNAELQRASRRSLTRYCTGESLAGNPRTEELILDRIHDFNLACHCGGEEVFCSAHR
jgi:hypothetical protein